MPKGNPARDIALSLGLAALFALGLVTYLLRTIKVPSPPVLLVNAPASPAIGGGAPANAPRGGAPATNENAAPGYADEAGRTASIFVAHLASSRHEEAYGMMAAAYRQRTSLDAFRAACVASPFLEAPERVSLSRTREEYSPANPKLRSLSASGIVTTKTSAADVTFFFVRDQATLAILNVAVAGSPSFPMGTASPAASGASKRAAPSGSR